MFSSYCDAFNNVTKNIYPYHDSIAVGLWTKLWLDIESDSATFFHEKNIIS